MTTLSKHRSLPALALLAATATGAGLLLHERTTAGAEPPIRDSARELSRAFREVARQISPSVVGILATHASPATRFHRLNPNQAPLQEMPEQFRRFFGGGGELFQELTPAPAPRTVIHKSKRTGRVVEEPIDTFAGGSTVRVLGYPGRLEAPEVLRRARARIGEPWTYTQNCQRFTRGCHGVPSRSPDVERTAVAGAIGAALAGLLVGR